MRRTERTEDRLRNKNKVLREETPGSELSLAWMPWSLWGGHSVGVPPLLGTARLGRSHPWDKVKKKLRERAKGKEGVWWTARLTGTEKQSESGRVRVPAERWYRKENQSQE